MIPTTLSHMGVTNTGKACVVVFPVIREDTSHAIIVEYDSLTDRMKQVVHGIANSQRALQASEPFLSDIMNQTPYKDATLLHYLHVDGLLHKYPVACIEMTKAPGVPISLPEWYSMKLMAQEGLTDDIPETVIDSNDPFMQLAKSGQPSVPSSRPDDMFADVSDPFNDPLMRMLQLQQDHLAEKQSTATTPSPMTATAEEYRVDSSNAFQMLWAAFGEMDKMNVFEQKIFLSAAEQALRQAATDFCSKYPTLYHRPSAIVPDLVGEGDDLNKTPVETSVETSAETSVETSKPPKAKRPRKKPPVTE